MSLSSTPAVARQPPDPPPTSHIDTTETVFIDTWTPKIDAMLLILRENCNYMSKYHNYKYQLYKERLKWFRIPIIVLSATNAFTAVGLQSYVPQQIISTVNSILSLLCGILTSIELFLNIQKQMENDLTSHKDYYVLGMDIFKMVSLDLSKRNVNGREFLEEKLSAYKKLVQSSNIIDVDFYIDIFDEDEDYYDLEADAVKKRPGEYVQTPPKVSFNVSDKYRSRSQTTTTRVANSIEKICTPNNHRINKYRKDMKSHIQKYSKTIRPQFMVPGATETVYMGIGRTSSTEDMSYPTGSSGKVTRSSDPMSPRQTTTPRPVPSMYDARTPGESFYRTRPGSTYISETPSQTATLDTTRKQTQIYMLPSTPPHSPRVPETVQQPALPSTEYLGIEVENPHIILAIHEHKDAGVEDSEGGSIVSYSSSSILGAK